MTRLRKPYLDETHDANQTIRITANIRKYLASDRETPA